MDLTIRDATAADLPAIVDIYNQSVPGGWSTAGCRQFVENLEPWDESGLIGRLSACCDPRSRFTTSPQKSNDRPWHLLACDGRSSCYSRPA
jgi:hypothetical protein